MRSGDGALTLLDDESRFGETLLPIGELCLMRGELRALRPKLRHRAAVARDEKAEHRHRLERIVTMIDGEKHSHVTESAHAIERGESRREELLLPLEPRRERGDLRFDRATLVVELRLQVDRELQLARANPELEIDRFELLLRRLRLSMYFVESRAQFCDLAANAIEVGVARGLGVRAREE